jgi:O-antigen/teichoic acid export membrane protein
MSSHTRDLARGFNWLGGATLAAKIIDFSTILAVLSFLTKDQVGIGSLVVSAGMVVEALDGFGTSEALTQASSVTRLQLDTLFWFIVGMAFVVGGLTLAAAPWIAVFYGASGMAAYFVAIAIKQPLVGAALIPLAMMNRELQFERIAVVNLCATLAAAATRLGLAIGGAGAWALVAAYVASGLFTLIAAQFARPFWPAFQFRMPAIAPLLRFGLRAATSNFFEQTFRNIDFLLVGWFYGPAPLAVYRVAFDVAMEPATAAGTLINRTAMPVFSRMAVDAKPAETLGWSLNRLATLVAPLMAGLILAADPLTALLHDQQGHSYAAAALPLKLLAAAALLRVTMQSLYPLLMGLGRPGTAARLSAMTMLLLTAGVLIAGFSFPAQSGLVAVSVVWLVIYPPLLLWGIAHLRLHWNIGIGELARSFGAPIVAIAALILAVEGVRQLTGLADPKIQVVIVASATALTYVGLALFARLRALR